MENGEGQTGMGKEGGVEGRQGPGGGRGGVGGGGGEDWEGAMGRGDGGRGTTGVGRRARGQRGGGKGKGKRRGDFTDGYDEMPGWTYRIPEWNEVTEFSDFVYQCYAGYPRAGTPASNTYRGGT